MCSAWFLEAAQHQLVATNVPRAWHGYVLCLLKLCSDKCVCVSVATADCSPVLKLVGICMLFALKIKIFLLHGTSCLCQIPRFPICNGSVVKDYALKCIKGMYAV